LISKGPLKLTDESKLNVVLSLTKEEAKLLFWKCHDDLQYKQVAPLVHVSPQTVQNRYSELYGKLGFGTSAKGHEDELDEFGNILVSLRGSIDDIEEDWPPTQIDMGETENGPEVRWGIIIESVE
jgi:hypothetical protein